MQLPLFVTALQRCVPGFDFETVVGRCDSGDVLLGFFFTSSPPGCFGLCRSCRPTAVGDDRCNQPLVIPVPIAATMSPCIRTKLLMQLFSPLPFAASIVGDNLMCFMTISLIGYRMGEFETIGGYDVSVYDVVVDCDGATAAQPIDSPFLCDIDVNYDAATIASCHLKAIIRVILLSVFWYYLLPNPAAIAFCLFFFRPFPLVRVNAAYVGSVDFVAVERSVEAFSNILFSSGTTGLPISYELVVGYDASIKDSCTSTTRRLPSAGYEGWVLNLEFRVFFDGGQRQWRSNYCLMACHMLSLELIHYFSLHEDMNLPGIV
ncbi:hypothetical protein M8C21_006421 [Ambrosia artemisiifolia]|uniref:Uncharacterized protein n=1 Tax=Ambrosia artemisiifolia TaxID=4212 RepID=A0AAD5CPB1_AMBAR|nr:hypothetical protein M8C21_006421 [Ambrosia artemisiifolia]